MTRAEREKARRENDQRQLNRPNDPEDFVIIIGRGIERHRKDLGWSYDFLSELSGVDKKLLIEYTKGKHIHASITNILEIALVLNTDIVGLYAVGQNKIDT